MMLLGQPAHSRYLINRTCSIQLASAELSTQHPVTKGSCMEKTAFKINIFSSLYPHLTDGTGMTVTPSIRTLHQVYSLGARRGS